MSKNGVTLKNRLGVVQSHWKWRRSIDHMRLSIGRPNIALSCTIFEFFWRWNRGQRSLNIIETSAIRKLGCGFLFAFYSNCGHICSRLWDVKEWRDLKHQVRGRSRLLKMAPFDRPLCDFLLVRHCKYSSILYHFRVVWRWIISWPWNLG